ncbi:MAG: hypothetical protein P8I38_06690 [Arenicella sp.]|jgi:uncharacterized membrane protein required for colicin V production|nr:hypothetical protein [Arenicella sp.]
MKKIGGFALMALGVLLILIAVLRTISVLMVFMSNGATSYGIGFIAGTALMLLLFSVLGVKAFKKGKSIVKPDVVKS